jgi:hypothetical protein
MTPEEFQYIKRAVDAMENQELSLEDQRKILQTVSEIAGLAAGKVQEQLLDNQAY